MRGTLLPWALLMACAPVGHTCPYPMPLYSPDVVPEDGGFGDDSMTPCGPICPNGEGYPGVDNPRFVIVTCEDWWCAEGYRGWYCVSRAGLEAYVAANPEVGELRCEEFDRDPVVGTCFNADRLDCHPSCLGKL